MLRATTTAIWARSSDTSVATRPWCGRDAGEIEAGWGRTFRCGVVAIVVAARFLPAFHTDVCERDEKGFHFPAARKSSKRVDLTFLCKKRGDCFCCWVACRFLSWVLGMRVAWL